MELEREINTYEAKKDQLLADLEGRFVLIKGEEIVADFAAYADALAEGYKRYGNENFLVKEVQSEDRVNYFSREIIVP